MRHIATLLLQASVLTSSATATIPAAPAPGRAVQGGVAVDFTVEPTSPAGALREGEEAVFRFRLSETATGAPLSGAYPAAWADWAAEAPGVEAPGCTKRVEELLGGSVLSRPEIDLNVYWVLALNEDATISVVDPLFGFGSTKLLAMVYLDSPGEDWVLSPDRRRLFVSLPASNQVAVVDTSSWQVVSKVPVGPRPARLALQPDGARLWVALDGGDSKAGVAAIDTADLRVVTTLPAGGGRHDIALSEDNRFVYVTGAADRSLAVIDAARLVKVGDVALGAAPTSIAYSPLAQAVYVSSEEAGVVVVVGGEGPQILARLQAEPGLGQIRFAPGGRLAFVVNPATDHIHIVDAARNRIVQTGDLLDGPDQVTFSQFLAYVRHRGSDTVLMIPLEEVGEEGKPVPVVDFPAGQHALGAGSLASPADSIVRAPGANAVLVANPADKAIYFYKEGMAAPMGSFKNYSRQPRAVLVVDRSLKERKPGSYETVARLPRPGHYLVAFFLDAPRAVHCFPLTVLADPAAEARRQAQQPARVEILFDTRKELPAGQAATVRFRLSDPVTGTLKDGVQDVEVLLYTAASHEQQRAAAKPVGDGVYEAEVTPPRAGTYHLAIGSPSVNLPFQRSPRVVLRVVDRP